MEDNMRYTVILTNGREISYEYMNGSNDRREAWIIACQTYGDSDASIHRDGWYAVAIVPGQHEAFGAGDFDKLKPSGYTCS